MFPDLEIWALQRRLSELDVYLKKGYYSAAWKIIEHVDWILEYLDTHNTGGKVPDISDLCADFHKKYRELARVYPRFIKPEVSG